MITNLQKNEVFQKQQLEQSVITGIELGKRGFQQAAQALFEIDQLGLWRDEATNFDQYREKFRELLADTDVSFRRLNQLIAAQKVTTILGTIVPREEITDKESHLRPLTGLKNPQDIQQAYKTAIALAQQEDSPLKAEHVKRAVEEIKPPKIRTTKPPRIPIGATVRILPHYADEAFHGVEGVITQHPSHDRCIVRFADETSKLIPDNMLAVVEEDRTFNSKAQEVKDQARSLGVPTKLPEVPRNDIPTQEQQQEIERAIALLLRLLPKFSQQQKYLVYEQLLKSGFNPGQVAA